MTNRAISPAEYKREAAKSQLEEHFAGQLRMLFLDNGWDMAAICREYRFHRDRRWRADFAIDRWFAKCYDPDHPDHDGCLPEPDLLIEIDGGTWSGGRHVTGAGFRNDCDKLNAAQLLGYTCLRFTSEQVYDGSALATVERALRGTEGEAS